MVEYIISELAAALETMRHNFHFPGHLLPGTAFIAMGVWWICSAFKIYIENEQRRNSEGLLSHEKNYVHDFSPFFATYNGHITGFLYCEGFYKIVYASFDLFCHLLVVVYGGDMTDEWQHMTVYVFFILNGIIDLILHIKLHKMPDGTDYIASSISRAAFGFLFISHKHAKTPISIYYHQMLGWLAVAVAVINLMQYNYERNTLIALIRGGCCTLAGAWLYQICCYIIINDIVINNVASTPQLPNFFQLSAYLQVILKSVPYLQLQIAFLFHNPFVAANQYRNMRQNGASSSPVDAKKISCSDTNALMVELMEVMNAVTIFTWLVIFVGCLVVFIGFVVSRRKQVYYKRIRHCCV